MSNSPTFSTSGVFAPGHRRLTIGIIASVSVAAFDALAATTLMPSAEEELGGLDLYSWAFTAFFLGSLLGAALVGPASDRRSPRTALSSCLAVFIVGLAVSALAGSMLQLVIGRGLQGVGGGAIIALAYALIGQNYPTELRPRMLAVLSSAWVIPSLLAPSIAAALSEAASWRWTFVVPVPILLLASALALPTVDATSRTSQADGESTVRAAVLTTISLGVLLGAFLIDSVIVAVAVVVPAAVVLIGAARRLVPVGTYRARQGVPTGVLIRGLLPMAYFGAEAFLALGVVELRDGSTFVSGLIITVGALGWTAGAWTQARLADTSGSAERRVAAGAALLSVGLVILGTILVTDAVPAVAAAIGWTVGGFGMGLAYPTTSDVVLDQTPEARHGFISSAMQSTEFLLVSVATGIGGAVLAVGHDTNTGDTVSDTETIRTGIVIAYAVAAATAALAAALANRTKPASSTTAGIELAPTRAD